MSAETFWRAVAQRLDNDTRVYVTMVVANTRGSPGTLGARLMVDANGHVEGTIGGGIMEANRVEHARQSLRDGTDGQPRLEHLVHRKELGARRQETHQPSGLICAGEQTNLSLILDPQTHRDAINRLCQAFEGQAGSSATLDIDAQGLSVSGDDTAQVEPGMHLVDSEDGWHYRESSVNPLRLVIVGGGHCGKALAQLALQLGYWVDVFDTRPGVLEGGEWADEARRHVLNDYSELNAQLQHPLYSTVVVMTAAVTHDIAALASVADTDLRWLGVMGSVAKIHEIRSQLQARGISQDRIDAIHGPIGARIKSDTPAEIAVSITSELLAERRGAN